MNKDRIQIYDVAPGTFSESTAIASVPYRCLSSPEYSMLDEFYGETVAAEKYSKQPPQAVVNIMAQMKLIPEVKAMLIQEEQNFPKEAMLCFNCPPAQGSYGDRKYLVSRWSLDDEHVLLSLDEIRVIVKERLMKRRQQLLEAAMHRIESDTEAKLNNGHDSHVTFDR